MTDEILTNKRTLYLKNHHKYAMIHLNLSSGNNSAEALPRL